MGSMASQITNLTIVYSAVYSGANQRKQQSFASLASVRGIHRGPENSPHKWPVTRKMRPFDDVIMPQTNSTNWPCFYQTRSAWSADQGSNKNHSCTYNFAPTVTKFCVMWERQALPHHTKFGNCRYKIVDSRAFLSWSLIHGLRWSGLIKAEPAKGSSDSMPSHTGTHTCLYKTVHSRKERQHKKRNDAHQHRFL